jgi:dGTPase
VEVNVLKAVAAVFVMRLDDRQPGYVEQREVLTALVRHLLDRDGRDLEPLFAADWAACSDDAGRLRVAVDQVATLTDASATSWARRLGAC